MSHPGFGNDAGRVTLWPILFQIADLQANLVRNASMRNEISRAWLPNSPSKPTNFRCNKIGHSVSGLERSSGQHEHEATGRTAMSLYCRNGARKYLSSAERERFLNA